ILETTADAGRYAAGGGFLAAAEGDCLTAGCVELAAADAGKWSAGGIEDAASDRSRLSTDCLPCDERPPKAFRVNLLKRPITRLCAPPRGRRQRAEIQPKRGLHRSQ